MTGTQGLVEGRPARVRSVGYVALSHEVDSDLDTSAKVSYGVLESDVVTGQNDRLTIL